MGHADKRTAIQRAVSIYAAEQGVTIESIAKAVGCGRTAFWMKCGGESEFRLGEGYRLAEILGIPLGELAAMARGSYSTSTRNG